MLDKYFTTSLNYFRTLNEETFDFFFLYAPPPCGCFATVMDTDNIIVFFSLLKISGTGKKW